MMLLSIIVPVYNGEKKIARCLESLTKLKEQMLEFLIVNDGSTDCTADIVESYIQRDSRFRLINQENSGVSSARNKGLEQCKAEYVGFVDADDEVTEDYNKVVTSLKKVNCDFYGFDYYIQTAECAEKKTRNLFVPGINEKETLCNNFLSGTSNNVWSNVYKKSIIQKHKLQFDKEMKMGEDSVFNSQYIYHCKDFYYIDCPAYKYYFDDINSASFKNKLEYLQDFSKMYDGFCVIYKIDENLNFSVKWELYFGPVCEILKKYGRQMTKEQNRVFRSSGFYKEISSRKQENWKAELRRWMMKANLYRIYLP